MDGDNVEMNYSVKDIRYKIGQTMDIKYNPQNPKEFVRGNGGIEKFLAVFLQFWGIVYFVAFILLCRLIF